LVIEKLAKRSCPIPLQFRDEVRAQMLLMERKVAEPATFRRQTEALGVNRADASDRQC
jgi:hypothetical protein